MAGEKNELNRHRVDPGNDMGVGGRIMARTLLSRVPFGRLGAFEGCLWGFPHAGEMGAACRLRTAGVELSAAALSGLLAASILLVLRRVDEWTSPVNNSKRFSSFAGWVNGVLASETRPWMFLHILNSMRGWRTSILAF